MIKTLLPLTLLLCMFASGSPRAHADVPSPPAASHTDTSAATPTPADAQRTLEILKDDKKRAQLIETLETIAKSPAGAQPPTSAPTAAEKLPIPLKPDGLGVQLLTDISDWIGNVVSDFGDTARAVTDFPALCRWVNHTVEDPAARARLLDALWKLAAVLASAIAVERIVILVLRHPMRSLERSVPAEASEINDIQARARQGRGHRFNAAWKLLLRLPFALARFGLDLLPVLAFAAVGNLLLGAAAGTTTSTRLVIIAVVDAYAICRVAMCLTRMAVSPGRPSLALIRVGDETAAYIEIWARRIVSIAIFGGALAGVARILGLAPSAYEALLKIVALIVHLFLIIIVLQCRRAIAARIRTHPEVHGTVALLRNRLGDVWHYLAIFLILASWVLWAVQVRNGFERLLHVILITTAVLVAARLAAIVLLGTLDRVFHVNRDVMARLPDLEARANRYYPLLRGTVTVVIWVAAAIGLFQAWGLNSLEWFGNGRIGDRVIGASITVGITALIAIAIWESANAAIDRELERLSKLEQLTRVVRLKTLLPMLRSTLLIAMITIVGLTILAEIGVNIAPLLAGAGIIGVAIGFGSQKLVQDLITGIFLLLENAMQVGDWVTVAGLSGTVEHLSIRTIRLRAGDGSVYIVPFSSVSTVNNINRGIGNAAVNVIVSAVEDTDAIGKILKEIAAELRKDEAFKNAILRDLELWGVDKIDGALVTIAGQIPCTDSGRWGVQREFNRRVKKRFQELGIQTTNPTKVLMVEPKPSQPDEGRANANGTEDPGPTEATTTESPPPAALGHTE